jgi:hypothetical protein
VSIEFTLKAFTRMDSLAANLRPPLTPMLVGAQAGGRSPAVCARGECRDRGGAECTQINRGGRFFLTSDGVALVTVRAHAHTNKSAATAGFKFGLEEVLLPAFSCAKLDIIVDVQRRASGFASRVPPPAFQNKSLRSHLRARGAGERERLDEG